MMPRLGLLDFQPTASPPDPDTTHRRAVVTGENVGAAGTLVGAADTVAQFAMHACGSIMLRNASADSISSAVALARRSRRCRAAAARLVFQAVCSDEMGTWVRCQWTNRSIFRV